MNNYLSYLAARSLAQADVILPRPSSLFETAASPTSPLDLEEQTVAEPHLPELPSSLSPAAPAVRQLQPEPEPTVTAVFAPPDHQEHITPHVSPLPEWLLQLQGLRQQPPPVHSTTLPPVAPAPPMDAPAGPSPEPVTAVAPPPTLTQIVTPSPTTPAPETIIERRHTETRLVERTERRPLISETVIEQNVYPRPEPQPAPPQNNVVSALQNVEQKVVVTETRPYTPPAQSVPLPKQQLESVPPTIHVTIGRVEVRATQPAAEPKKRPPRAQSPVMSLDEYLQQRANGVNR
jgi:hypothetical protein